MLPMTIQSSSSRGRQITQCIQRSRPHTLNHYSPIDNCSRGPTLTVCKIMASCSHNALRQRVIILVTQHVLEVLTLHTNSVSPSTINDYVPLALGWLQPLFIYKNYTWQINVSAQIIPIGTILKYHTPSDFVHNLLLNYLFFQHDHTFNHRNSDGIDYKGVV